MTRTPLVQRIHPLALIDRGAKINVRTTITHFSITRLALGRKSSPVCDSNPAVKFAIDAAKFSGVVTGYAEL